MLKGNLYDIKSMETVGGKTVADVILRPGCEIYKAHFPGRHITPGVCLVKTAQELVEELESRTLHICEAKDIKFISLGTPDGTPEIRYELTQGEKNADCEKWSVCVFASGSLCCKMSVPFSRR